MREEVRSYLSAADPILGRILTSLDVPELTPSKSYFADLCEIVINQQLSEKAGKTIFSRFVSLFPNKSLTPQRVLAVPPETIRSQGVSGAKTKSIQAIAQAFYEKSLPVEQFLTMSEAQIMEHLTKIKGIGPWSAEMFLMFSLAREDVFSIGDVGLRNAIMKIYAYKTIPTPTQLQKLSLRWKPYRTYVCRVLWKYLDTKSTS